MAAHQIALVTGASGFVGMATLQALRNSGWQVVAATRKAVQGSAEHVYLDLEDPASIMALSKGQAFDAIVHLGARIGWSGESESDLLMPNVLATGLLIELSNRWKAQFVFASAAIVHGARTPQIDNRSKIKADTPYANSKWLAEQLCSCLQGDGCILRIAGVFGAKGPSHLGLNRAITGVEKGILPALSGSGAALRNYIYVKDVARAIVFALEQKLIGTHLLSGNETLSIRKMLETLCEIYLPGQLPCEQEGAEAGDQVITASSALPSTRSFHAAVTDMHTELLP